LVSRSNTWGRKRMEANWAEEKVQLWCKPNWASVNQIGSSVTLWPAGWAQLGQSHRLISSPPHPALNPSLCLPQSQSASSPRKDMTLDEAALSAAETNPGGTEWSLTPVHTQPLDCMSFLE
jgi:hypothetical protein